MAPIYAGILGILAFLTCLAHGTVHATDSDMVLLRGCGCLVGFAALGYLIGAIAERTIQESVRAVIEAEVEAARRADGDVEA